MWYVCVRVCMRTSVRVSILPVQNGQKTANVTLSIINDNIPEINETFGIALSSPTGGARLSATPDTVSVWSCRQSSVN